MGEQFRQAEEALLDPEVRKKFEQEEVEELERMNPFIKKYKLVDDRLKAFENGDT